MPELSRFENIEIIIKKGTALKDVFRPLEIVLVAEFKIRFTLFESGGLTSGISDSFWEMV